MNSFKIFLASFLTLLGFIGKTQITVDNTVNPTNAVNNILLGNGVTASNITFNGNPGTTNSVQIGSFNAVGTTFPISNGIILATSDVIGAVGPNNDGGGTPVPGGSGMGFNDPDLDIIAGIGTNDAAILEFDFVPVGDTLKFTYVFGSEEYPEYVNSINDVFGFFLSGPGIIGTYSSPAAFPNGSINIAQIPNGGGPVTINNVNDVTNSAYYVDNTNGLDIQYDGHTVVLTAIAPVQCGQTYHIKIAIADASDDVWNSGVFLEAESFSSDAVEVNIATVTGDTTIIEGCDDAVFYFTRPNTDSLGIVQLDISGTATMGIDYANVTDSIVFPVGIDSVALIINTIEDDFTPGGNEAPEIITITAFSVSPCGDTLRDTGFVYIIEEPIWDVTLPLDTTIVCPQDSIEIPYTINGGLPSYLTAWSDGSQGQSIWVPANIPGANTYYVSITDSCTNATISDSIVVTVNPYTPTSVDAGANQVLTCPGIVFITATAQDGVGTYDYSWDNGGGNNASFNPNVNSSITYTVTATDDCGISAIDSIIISLNPTPPTVNAYGDITLSCPGDAATIGATATSVNPPLNFNWSTNETDTTITINPLQTTTYYITITDACDPVGVTDSVVVAVTPAPALSISGGPETPGCPGDVVTLDPIVTGGYGGYTYDWNGTSTDTTLTVSPNTNQQFFVTITDACGLTQTGSIDVIMPVFPPFTFNFVHNDTACSNTEFPMGAGVSGGAGGYSVEWTGEGIITPANQGTTGIVNSEAGYHYYTFTVTDQCGNIGFDSTQIYIDECALSIPNVITPIAVDGANDTWVIPNLNNFEHNVQIFNRWGRKVYESTDYQNDWNGDGLSHGVYFYVITVQKNQEETYNGTVTIMK